MMHVFLKLRCQIVPRPQKQQDGLSGTRIQFGINRTRHFQMTAWRKISEKHIWHDRKQVWLNFTLETNYRLPYNQQTNYKLPNSVKWIMNKTQ